MATLSRRMNAGRGMAALVLAMTWGATAMAGKAPPPGIDDLDGAVFTLKVSGKAYDRATGAADSVKSMISWTVTKIGPDRVSILERGDGSDSVHQAYYAGGLLIVGRLDNTDLATDAACGQVLVSGSTGKLKLKGEAILIRVVDDDEVTLVKLSGKQTSNPMP